MSLIQTVTTAVKKIPLFKRLRVQLPPCPHCRCTVVHSPECPEQPVSDEYANYLRKEITDLRADLKRYHNYIQVHVKERTHWEGKFRIVCHENNKLRAKFQVNRARSKIGRGAVISDEAEGFMPMGRWVTLMKESPDLPLTPEEIAAGWHYCTEWDGLLVGPGMSEEDACSCPTPSKRKVSGLCKE